MTNNNPPGDDQEEDDGSWQRPKPTVFEGKHNALMSNPELRGAFNETDE